MVFKKNISAHRFNILFFLGRLASILEPFMNETEDAHQKLEMSEEGNKAVVKERDEERYTLLLTAGVSSASSLQVLPAFAIAAILLRLLLN